MSRPTVLYVEDEADDVLFMCVAFKRLGVQAELQSVQDGARAIAYLAGLPPFDDRGQYPVPAIMLLDLNLPLRSGFEVLHWLRLDTRYKSLPVVIFSSSGRPEDRSRANELGATDYVLKPSSGVKFVNLVRRLKDEWLGEGIGRTGMTD